MKNGFQEEPKAEKLGEEGDDELDRRVTGHFQRMDDGEFEAGGHVVGENKQGEDGKPAKALPKVTPGQREHSERYRGRE